MPDRLAQASPQGIGYVMAKPATCELWWVVTDWQGWVSPSFLVRNSPDWRLWMTYLSGVVRSLF
ncbi:MAG: hypothetical protein ACREP9_11800 [Candidatus Dormibacteraceae bacterium]